MAERVGSLRPYTLRADEVFDFEYVKEVSDLVGIETQVIPIPGLGPIIKHEGERWIVTVGEDADVGELRWATTVAAYCRMGHSLAEALELSRDLLILSSCVKNGVALACPAAMASYAGVPIHVVVNRVTSLGAECCGAMCGSEAPCFDPELRLRPRICLIVE